MIRSVFILFSLVSCTYLYGAQPDIYFSFDRDYRADHGGTGDSIEVAGQEGPSGVHGQLLRGVEQTVDAVLTNGLRGRGLRLGPLPDGKEYLSVRYQPKDGLSASEGTVSFWMRPDSWKAADRQFQHFFSAQTPDGQRLLIYKYIDNPKLVFYYGEMNGEARSVSADISSWEPGFWHHIAAAWNAQSLELYVDGNRVGLTPLEKVIEKPFSSFQLGEYWSGNPGTTSLDELRIFSRKLALQEMQQEFLRCSAETRSHHAPVQLAVGKSPAAVDGRILPGEYMLGFSGMFRSFTPSANYALKQSKVFLSWDQDQLYLGVRTDATKSLLAKHQQQDEAIWEDDAIEIFLYGFNESRDLYQFIINRNGVFYDSKNRKVEWNSKNLHSQSTVNDGIWEFEIVLPWENFGFTAVPGAVFRLNVCRDDRSDDSWSCIAPGDYFATPQYASVTLLDETAPCLELGSFGALYDGKIDCLMRMNSSVDDLIQAEFLAPAAIFPFRYAESIELDGGKLFEKTVSGTVPRNSNLQVSIRSDRSGLLYQNSIAYVEMQAMKLAYLYTEIAEQKLVLVTRNLQLFTGKNGVRVRLYSGQAAEPVLEQFQAVDDTRVEVHNLFDIRELPAGQYRLHYELLGPDGKVFAEEDEEYAKYEEKRPWTDSPYGKTDRLPPPWTPIECTDAVFRCWGRQYQFGNDAFISSLSSQNRELLRRPVQMVLNGKPVMFESQLIEKGNSHALYQLRGVDRSLQIQMEIKAEFDGLLWCTLTLAPGTESTVRDLTLQIPLDRSYVSGFDDGASIVEKRSFLNLEKDQFYLDPIRKANFWCGGDDVGIMGGASSHRGWYVKNKAEAMQVKVDAAEVLIQLHLIDSNLQLDAERHLEFYLQTTPVKPKSTVMGSLRDQTNMLCWGDYVTQYFAHKRPGGFVEERISRYRALQEEKDWRVFYYCAPKGASPFSPEWNYFGKLWHCRPPVLGEYMKDAEGYKKDSRNFYSHTYACLNSRDFFDFKLDSIVSFLRHPEYHVRDLYFDLTWPRPCSNASHGCLWKDEFGYEHHDTDLKALRELLKRIYIEMKRKNPEAMFRGHLLSNRTPADVFYDNIVMGELLDRYIIANEGSYYDVLTPSLARIAYSSRSNEADISLIPQFERATRLFAANQAEKLNVKAPEMDRAICHFLGYMLVHNLNVHWQTESPRLPIFQAAQDWIGRNENLHFYPYWHPDKLPVRMEKAGERTMLSAYQNSGRILLALLNDSDQSETVRLQLDGAALQTVDPKAFRDLLEEKTYRAGEDGVFTMDLRPRQAMFLKAE